MSYREVKASPFGCIQSQCQGCELYRTMEATSDVAPTYPQPWQWPSPAKPPFGTKRSEGSLNKLFMGAARTPQGQRDCFWDWAEFQANSEA